MSILERLGIRRGGPSGPSGRERELIRAREAEYNFLESSGVFEQLYQKIAATGGVDLLVGVARGLREKGDPTAMVAEDRFCIPGYAAGVKVALRYERVKRAYLASSTWWESKGIAIEASGRSKDKPLIHVRFTDGNSWNSFEHDQTPNGLARFREVTRGIGDPTEEEKSILESGGREGSLETQLRLAQRIARRQLDYSFGESETPQPRTDKKFRVIF